MEKINRGFLELIWGGMFSGKSQYLLQIIKQAQTAQKKILLFKPQMDTRYNRDYIVCHNQKMMPAIAIKEPTEIFSHLQNFEFRAVIGIDEAQFLSEQIVAVCRQLADRGYHVIVAGLDQDFQAKPFINMAYLACEADKIIKLKAICAKCQNPAHRSFRLTDQKDQFVLGEKDKYQPLCRVCYNKFYK